MYFVFLVDTGQRVGVWNLQRGAWRCLDRKDDVAAKAGLRHDVAVRYVQPALVNGVVAQLPDVVAHRADVLVQLPLVLLRRKEAPGQDMQSATTPDSDARERTTGKG